jgi:uncharacterized repeat protein (TIGR04138 family)
MLDPAHPIAELLRRDRRYQFDAYAFVFEALRYAQEVLGMGAAQAGEEGDDVAAGSAALPPRGSTGEQCERHLTGQELCEAIRKYALQQYGYLAKSVLNHWGVHRTSDFGEIVFNLIDIGQMRKTPQDRREDFDAVYDFDEALQAKFEFTQPE